MKLSGVHTAIVTPLTENGVDYEGLKQNIHYQINAGVAGIVAVGTTGEIPTLTAEEIDHIIQISVETAKNKVQVMIGTSHNCTDVAVKNTQNAEKLGADTALVATPYYNKPSQEGIFRHFKAIIDNSNIPIVVYNIPARTGKNIETTTLKRIAELPRVIAVKESSGDLNQCIDVVNEIVAHKPEFSLISGEDRLTLPILTIGGVGVISVTSNIVPQLMVNMIKAIEGNDLKKARQLHYQMEPFFNALNLDTNPVVIKEAMNLCQRPAGICRMPLCEMSEVNKEKLKNYLQQMNLL